MESDGTHGDSSEADSSLKVASQQQTSWIVVLCQVGVPAAVIAHVFGLSEHTVRAIERGISRTKIVSAIKSELQSQLPLLQQSRGFSLDTKLGMLLSGSFRTREVLTAIQRECQRKIKVLEDPSRARKSRPTEKFRMRATDTAITTVLRSANASN
jgi:hypothetical protein